jgi:nicotinamidase-related amidase
VSHPSLVLEASGTVSGSRPYSWPYHGALVPEQTALVALVDPRWRIKPTQGRENDERLVQLATGIHGAGGFVVAITVAASPPVHDGLGSESTAVLDLEADVEIEAVGTSGFQGSRLDHELRTRNLTDLILAGWGLEGPVHSTLRAANDRGYECLLVSDASTTLDPSLTFAADQMVCFSGGIFGAVAQTSDVIAAFGRGQTEGRTQ